MKRLITASALAIGLYAGAAQAAPTITSPMTINAIDFGTGNGAGYQAVATAAAAASGLVFSPLTSGVFSGSSAGTTSSNGYSSPFGVGSNKNYLAIEPGGSITFAFTSAQTTFAALVGTLDSYNSFTFGVGPTAQTFTGSDVAAALGVAANGSSTKNVLFSGLNSFTTVTLSDSTFSAFEFAPGSAVPEPAAWGMMILGFGLVGGVLRRRPSVKVKYA